MITVGLSLNGEPQDNVEVLRLTTTNEVSGPYRADVELIVQDGARLQREALVGAALALSIRLDDSDARPTIAGRIRAAEQDHDADNGTTIVSLTVTPRFAGLGAEEQCATYAGMTPAQIIAAVLARNDLQEGRDFEIRLEDESVYFPLPFVAQFDESDLDFVRRIAEYWGLAYALEPGPDDLGLLVFSDQPQAFRAIRGTELPYVSSGHHHGVIRLKRSMNELPREVMLQNYDPERPAASLVVTCPVPAGTMGRLIEHDHNFISTDRDGQLLARLRAEELSSRRIVFTGEGASVTLRAGGLCTLTGHPVWGDLQLFLTRVVSTFENTPYMQGKGTVPTATQSFEALPLAADGVPLRFRPQRRARKPQIHGVIHGIVEEQDDRLAALVDDNGCYRVRLLAHGSDEGPGRAVYPHVRMAQPVGGAGSGMHFPLHPGTEVLLSFVDGDPDRPVICGAVPNLRDRSVVGRANAGENMIRTAAGARLQFDDGTLSPAGDTGPASNIVTSETMRTKVVVPWDGTNTGSYLRLGRADAAEPAEARGPGSALAGDGWYDFTNGARASVTLGATDELFGGDRVTRQYGMAMTMQFRGGALQPLGTDTAGDGEFDSRTEDNGAISLVASYDSLEGGHEVAVSARNASSYTLGFTYSYTLGARIFTNVGVAVTNNAGLSYATTLGASASFNHSARIGYTRGANISVDESTTWRVAATSSLEASKLIELSMRNPLVTEGQQKVQKALYAATAAFTAANVGIDATYDLLLRSVTAATDSPDLDAIQAGDHAVSAIRGFALTAGVLTAVAVAAQYVRAAGKTAGDALGFGPSMSITPRAARIEAGPRIGAGEAMVRQLVTAERMSLAAGPGGVGSRATIEPGGIALTAGPACFIRVGPGGIELGAGPMAGLKITPAGVSVTGTFACNMQPLGAPPLPSTPPPPLPTVASGLASN